MENNKLSWNAKKKELWKSSQKDLLIKLQELEKEKFKMEITSRNNGHSSTRQINTTGNKFNMLKELRHRIACIKTMLHVKMQGGK